MYWDFQKVKKFGVGILLFFFYWGQFLESDSEWLLDCLNEQMKYEKKKQFIFRVS